MADNPDELVRKAHSKLTPSFFGKMFSSKESRMEEAIELLGNAVNLYKINKDWKKQVKPMKKWPDWKNSQGVQHPIPIIKMQLIVFLLWIKSVQIEI